MKRPLAACRYVCGSLAAITAVTSACDCRSQYIVCKL